MEDMSTLWEKILLTNSEGSKYAMKGEPILSE